MIWTNIMDLLWIQDIFPVELIKVKQLADIRFPVDWIASK